MSQDPARPRSALTEAHEVTARASERGFDWPDISGVWDKLREEMGELEVAAAGGQPERIADELGDLLFSVVNLSRFLGADPEQALERATVRFRQRFAHVVRSLEARGRQPEGATLEEMEELWQEAKRLERAGPGEASGPVT